jgi:hypothetical protein
LEVLSSTFSSSKFDQGRIVFVSFYVEGVTLNSRWAIEFNPVGVMSDLEEYILSNLERLKLKKPADVSASGLLSRLWFLKGTQARPSE